MKNIKDYLVTQDDFAHIIDGIETGMNEQLVSGLTNSTRAVLASLIHESAKQPILYVTHQLSQAQKVYEELLSMSEDESKIHLYPANELLAAEIVSSSPELKAQRLEALKNWQKHEKGVMVVPVSALKRLLPPKEIVEQFQVYFKVGEEKPLEEAIKDVQRLGYKMVDLVNAPGEMSRVVEL